MGMIVSLSQAIIDAILSGRDAMAHYASAGRSLFAFQVPALLLPGVTLVISPHMQDPGFNDHGHTVLINSGQSLEENRQAIVALSGQVKLLYCARTLVNDYF